ncbi:2714_t:CDS:2 [Ambispora leptoticha]|uniref:2714_t:CDS:1 n=1 Tax=Ambispora leptoticha TaxID=144679 RepID=A0A9N9AF74_9GLOM|nr:2714_t:CDS:2 [Ambispora leptoticha]
MDNINERQEDPLGPNYDRTQVASQAVWNIYKCLRHSSQLNKKQAESLSALKFFLGDEPRSQNNDNDTGS